MEESEYQVVVFGSGKLVFKSKGDSTNGQTSRRGRVRQLLIEHAIYTNEYVPRSKSSLTGILLTIILSVYTDKIRTILQ